MYCDQCERECMYAYFNVYEYNVPDLVFRLANFVHLLLTDHVGCARNSGHELICRPEGCWLCSSGCSKVSLDQKCLFLP